MHDPYTCPIHLSHTFGVTLFQREVNSTSNPVRAARLDLGVDTGKRAEEHALTRVSRLTRPRQIRAPGGDWSLKGNDILVEVAAHRLGDMADRC